MYYFAYLISCSVRRREWRGCRCTFRSTPWRTPGRRSGPPVYTADTHRYNKHDFRILCTLYALPYLLYTSVHFCTFLRICFLFSEKLYMHLYLTSKRFTNKTIFYGLLFKTMRNGLFGCIGDKLKPRSSTLASPSLTEPICFFYICPRCRRLEFASFYDATVLTFIII